MEKGKVRRSKVKRKEYTKNSTKRKEQVKSLEFLELEAIATRVEAIAIRNKEKRKGRKGLL